MTLEASKVISSPGLALVDQEGRFLFINNELADINGFPVEAHIGRTIRDILPPAFADQAEVHYKQVFQTGKPLCNIHFHGETLAQPGVVRLWNVSLYPLMDEAGKVVAINVLVEEVVQSNIEEELELSKEREAFLSSALEGSSQAFSASTPDGYFKYFNNAYLNLTGYQEKEMYHKTWIELTPPEWNDHENKILEELHRTGQPQQYQKEYIRKDGSRIPIELKVHLTKTKEGESIYYAFFDDITERKRVESELKRVNAQLKTITINLEERVKLRTRQLAEQAEQLRLLARELTDAEQNERKRLAQVLHDHIQQFLIAAKIRIELMERKSSPLNKNLHDARLYIEKATEAARSLTAELRPPVLYESGLGAALRFLARKFEEHYQFKVNYSSFPTTEPYSDFIKIMIYQSVQEIFLNIVKYAEVKECSLEFENKGDGHFYLKVQDAGVGFDTSLIGKKGSGFGLYSIRERIKAIGGEFKIHSKIGEGSIFEIFFKSAPEDASQKTAPLDKISDQPTLIVGKKNKDGLRVLLADDHTIVRQSICSVLLKHDFIYEVIEACDGEDAVAKAKVFKPDLVIMDLNMPRLNGIEATRLIKQEWPHLAVIGLSVQTEVETAQAMLEAGAIGYFNKTENITTLIEKIKRLAIAIKNK